MQVPQPDDPHAPITRVQHRAGVCEVCAFVPHDVDQVVRHLGRVEYDAAHAVDRVQQQRQLKRAVDAREHLGRVHVRGPQVPDVRHVERRYAQSRRTSGRGVRPAPPPWVLGLVHQALYVLMNPLQPDAHCQARDVEKLFDYDAIDVGQEREQADEVLVVEPADDNNRIWTKFFS